MTERAQEVVDVDSTAGSEFQKQPSDQIIPQLQLQHHQKILSRATAHRRLMSSSIVHDIIDITSG